MTDKVSARLAECDRKMAELSDEWREQFEVERAWAKIRHVKTKRDLLPSEVDSFILTQ